MTALVKFVHVGAIAVWSAGLLVVPFLIWQRRGLPAGDALDRLHRMTRFVLVGLASPAAFVAIGTGAALILLRATYHEWFSLKLLFVSAMMALHVVAGRTVLRAFATDRKAGVTPVLVLSIGNVVAIGAILYLVLGKPAMDAQAIAPTLFAPGALGEIVRQLFGDTRIPTP